MTDVLLGKGLDVPYSANTCYSYTQHRQILHIRAHGHAHCTFIHVAYSHSRDKLPKVLAREMSTVCYATYHGYQLLGNRALQVKCVAPKKRLLLLTAWWVDWADVLAWNLSGACREVRAGNGVIWGLGWTVYLRFVCVHLKHTLVQTLYTALTLVFLATNSGDHQYQFLTTFGLLARL